MSLLKNKEGSSLIEYALSASIFLMILFGFIQFSLAFYTYNYMSDAARTATRYAVVRGPDSCTLDTVTDPNCNLNPSKFTSNTDPTKNPLLAFLSSVSYPGIKPQNMSVNATWLIASQDVNGVTTWTTACPNPATNLDANGLYCNAVGNAVKVVVTYSFPINVPSWKNMTIPITSTSQMVISE
ncbi:MAG: TadE/TadG family type IV pilus assembly protein [Acidobacteriaceae bacterium]|nr:TadE/TadG family type IV pilus assembly protein [Acidobacteriaceae bacterium]